MALKRLYQHLTDAQIQAVFGSFPYKTKSNGSIEIQGDWISKNIVSCTLVKAKNGQDVKTRCHKLAKDAFEHAYQELAELGLSKYIHTWDGLFVPRHKVWNPANSLSPHSWGIAVDMNAQTNPFGGKVTAENIAMAEVFVRYGFDWGGFWKPKNRDGMHYELVDPNAWKKVKEVVPARELVLGIKRTPETIQYIRSSTGQFKDDRWTVNSIEAAALLGTHWPGGKVQRLFLTDVLEKLGWQVFEVSKPSTGSQPSQYVFVERAS